VQKRAAPVILGGDDCIIQSETGSGKTLSFLLPLLSWLSYPPDTYPDDLKASRLPDALRHDAVQAPGSNDFHGCRPAGCCFRAQRRSPTPAPPRACLQGPQAVVVVPTRELGVQLVMLVYRLFGGSVNQGVPGQGGNMFDYHGPRGLKASCCNAWGGGGLPAQSQQQVVIFCCAATSGRGGAVHEAGPHEAGPARAEACCSTISGVFLRLRPQVKGLLLGSEVLSAKKEGYLRGAHVLVGERAGQQPAACCLLPGPKDGWQRALAREQTTAWTPCALLLKRAWHAHAALLQARPS
jgi:hypothetical protein